MITVIFFILLTFLGFGIGVLGLTFYCILAGEPLTLTVCTYISSYLWYYMGICIVASLVYRLCLSIKDVKSPLYRELQSYTDYMVSRIPEISDLRVKLHITNETIFQGHALPKRHIYLSRPWITAAAINGELLEYAKSTICHELYHISCRHRYPFSFMSLLVAVAGLFCKPFRDRYYIKMWLEELNADRMACIWHGDKDVTLAKMEAMKKLRTGKESLTDHPTWDIRIRYIREDIVPTMENVVAEYREYCTYLKNKRRK